MLTPRVDLDHDNHGFIHDWVVEIASKMERLHVICLERGRVDLPDNVELSTLDTEGHRVSKFIRLNRILLSSAPHVDGIFTHMFPEFPILVAPYAQLFRKRLIMWYTHGSTPLSLRVSLALVNHAVTASRESLRLENEKVVVIGHGIDTKKFRPNERRGTRRHLTLLTVGRIDPIKRLERVVEILENLRKLERTDAYLRIVGAPMENTTYLGELKELIDDRDLSEYVEFGGPVPYTRIEEEYQSCDIFLSMSDTGSIDKAVLEAMACQLITITSNRAFKGILPKECVVSDLAPDEIARQISRMAHRRDTGTTQLRATIIKEHSLERLTERLVSLFRSGRA
ncbi:MAG: glycosyltransferase family 4 protein [Candidatus Undinarchaeales archaeon]|nr:glycosyltransferase family 4 protein [Candidatus Undinarchaeales archaeon]